MVRIATLIILISSFTSSVNAQQLSWVSAIGGVNSDICKNIGYDDDGNVYISGYLNESVTVGDVTLTSNGGPDIYVAKYSSEGVLEWAFNVGGESGDEPSDMYVDGDGNIYITGHFGSTVDFDPSVNTKSVTSSGGDDVFLARYSTEGKLKWVKTFGSSAPESKDRANALAYHKFGYIFLTGIYDSEININTEAGNQHVDHHGDWDVFYAKYDTRGRNHFIRGFGGPGRDAGRGITVSQNFRIYISGYFAESMDMDPRSNKVFELTSSGGEDIFVAKYKIGGELQWAQGFGSTGNDRALDIGLHNNNHIAITGFYQYDVDFAPNESDLGELSGTKFENIYLAQFNQNGTLNWVNGFGGNLRDVGRAVEIDQSGNIYTTGYFTNEVNLDPLGILPPLTIGGNWDAYFAKFDKNGRLQWSFSVAGPFLDYGFDIKKNSLGEVFIAGRFTTETTVNLGIGPNLTSAGVNDAFFGKVLELPDVPTITQEAEMLYSSSPRNNQWFLNGQPIEGANQQFIVADKSGDYKVSVSNELGEESISTPKHIQIDINENTVTIYPNPSSGYLYFDSPLSSGSEDIISISILNSNGMEVYSGSITGNNNTLQSDFLQSGIHTVVLRSNDTVITKKVLIQ